MLGASCSICRLATATGDIGSCRSPGSCPKAGERVMAAATTKTGSIPAERLPRNIRTSVVRRSY